MNSPAPFDNPASEPFSALPAIAPRPELLAPAGDWDCARAAVENGADAIYFGLDKFNARMRAQNFTAPDLPVLMRYLHERGVRGYVTFNTLVFTDELDEAERHLRAIIAGGADAVLVQDTGLCRMIRAVSPDFPMHASTQMTVTSAGGVAFANELGCELVVLARECSSADIGMIRSGLRGKGLEGYPLEVFVHGALCVAYSGQCLTSEALGGRSANRGECAQACRMPYELISDGAQIPLGDRKYLLSPQDLAGIELMPELLGQGVVSFKIEGRLKSPEYVANITRLYRSALDRAVARTPALPTAQDRYEMEMAFSRGLYTGWFRGNNNQELVHARFGKKRGVYLGKVCAAGNETVTVEIEGNLKAGDGVVFDSGLPESEETGGRVFTMEQRGGRAVLRFLRGAVDFRNVAVGARVWKTGDPELERRLRQSFAGHEPKFQRPLRMEVRGACGTKLEVQAQDELGHCASAESGMVLEEAENQPLTDERLRDQLGRLGGTPFRLQELRNHIEGRVVLPIRELNRMRRQIVEELRARRAAPKKWTLTSGAIDWRGGCERAAEREPVHLVVLVRNLPQLAAALESGAERIYCDFEDPKKYREAVRDFRSGTARETGGSAEIFVAPPRIFKSGEEWILDQVLSCEADGILARNYDHLGYFKGCRRIGDFSFNVANPWTASYFIEQKGLERVTASYDLNARQLDALLAAAPAHWFEITLHQHMPMFHMEHCVFCAFLSNGKDYKDCGRPCDKHQVSLRDRVGLEHPVKADLGCRNTVFNARAQTGVEYLDGMRSRGAARFRIEFLNETPAEVKRTIDRYQRVLKGELAPADLWRELRLTNQLGVTRGTMGASQGNVPAV